ncbi:phospholipase D family protein [Noviherbaspirillum cavernae]|uniref:phospholipase D n=1 Tax=Noviherbaspirillum cavernae TaxID=2320862 RepID=A0A418X2S5_9BURK|nr:phospholipase D family protein [Noviherbaspirillum cavernae]RJG06763.1 phospholipase D family protein [Noviherbaspirillum cavernae]
MSRSAGALAWAMLLAAPSLCAADATVPPAYAAQGFVQVAFSPWDNVEALIADTIGTANRQVLVQAYLLTSKRIASALIAAQRRSVEVRVLADGEQVARTASSMVPVLAAAGIPVWIETKYQNAHNKIIVIDPGTSDAAVITGSYNFTWTAQHGNAENVLIVRNNPQLASRYVLNWERHRQDAVPYKK